MEVYIVRDRNKLIEHTFASKGDAYAWVGTHSSGDYHVYHAYVAGVLGLPTQVHEAWNEDKGEAAVFSTQNKAATWLGDDEGSVTVMELDPAPPPTYSWRVEMTAGGTICNVEQRGPSIYNQIIWFDENLVMFVWAQDRAKAQQIAQTWRKKALDLLLRTDLQKEVIA